MAYEPQFNISARLLSLGEEIAVLRERIQGAAVSVSWIPALQKDTRTCNGPRRLQARCHGPAATAARRRVDRENRGQEDRALFAEEVETAFIDRAFLLQPEQQRSGSLRERVFMSGAWKYEP